MRHDPSVPHFYTRREMNGLERKAAGLGRSGDLKKSLTHAQKRKRQQIVAKSDLLSGSSSLPANDLRVDDEVTTILTNSNSANDPPPNKKRRLSADKALIVSEIGIENINFETISLGRRKRRIL